MAPTAGAAKSKKPSGSNFAQQNMPAFRPLFTPMAVGSIFLIIGVPFVILGAIVNVATSSIKEVSLEYSELSDCKILSTGAAATCQVTVKVDDDMPAPVYVYYELTSFYQNHRSYVKSYDKSQLLGDVEWTEYTDKNCAQLSLAGDGVTKLHPCGLMANSLFNDKILVSSGQSVSYDGIAWSTDGAKYVQPEGFKFKEDTTIGAACTGACSDAQCASVNYGKGCKRWSCPAGEEGYYGCKEGKSYVYWWAVVDCAIKFGHWRRHHITNLMTFNTRPLSCPFA
mmetsp:Transcript_9637/g.21987  ORF Transcript_9637/g.21987 Transcript_9637/m.21987 type:complete len:282 (-) Transcript_9637:662-1507(-)